MNIKELYQIYFGSKLVILGDMMELGNYSEEYHQMIVDRVNQLGLTAILVGDKFNGVKNKYNFEYVCGVDDVILPPEYSNILIKGSHIMGLEKIVLK